MNLEQNFRDLRVHKWYNKFLWFFATHILFLFNKIYFGLQIESNENVRELKTEYLSIYNHVHYLDCAMVVNALSNRCCFFPTLEKKHTFLSLDTLYLLLADGKFQKTHQGLNVFHN